MIKPKLPFRQFFDFRFGVQRHPLLQSPPPYPNAAQPTRSALSVSQLAAPIEGVLGTSERNAELGIMFQ
jgi:hypothetical protein